MSQLVLANILAGSGNVLAGGDNSGNVNKVTIGSNLTLSGGVLSATGGGSGSVTSVAVSRSGNALAITGSPITTSGTINIGFSGNSGQYIDGSGNLTTFPSIITQAQNLVTEVYNETGATLTKGTVVYINGGHGNLPTVTKAIATGDATSAQTYGVVRADITNMNNGYVTVFGNLDNMDTQAYTAGTQLYLSSTTAGAYTSVKQYAPAHLVYVGIVVRSHPTQGVIEIRIQNGFELDELHNVSAQTPSNGDILQYNSTTSLWTSVAGTTTNIAEGTNLYFTNARARGVLSTNVGSALSYNSTTGRFTLNAADSGTDGYLTSADWTDFDSKQASLGTGTTSQYLRGDLTWAAPPAPALDDLTDVVITTPTNGQVLTYRFGDWKNETPATAPVTSVFGRTGDVVAVSGDYTTDLVTEATNLYYTSARARSAISVNVGSALTYNNTTGRLTLNAATALTDGYLTAADYTNFDSKQASLGTGTTSQFLRGDLVWAAPAPISLDQISDVDYVGTPTTGQLLRYRIDHWENWTPTYVAAGFFSATAPLSYNSTTGVFSISLANSTTNGYLSSTDWNTFNSKQSALTFSSPLVNTSGTITINQATSSTNGYLSSTDWNTFNNKQNALTNPVTGTGTTNNIPKFTGTSTIGNSNIADNGSSIELNSARSSSYTSYIWNDVSVYNTVRFTDSTYLQQGRIVGSANSLQFDVTNSNVRALTLNSNASASFSSRINVNGTSDDADISVHAKSSAGTNKYTYVGRDSSSIWNFSVASDGTTSIGYATGAPAKLLTIQSTANNLDTGAVLRIIGNNVPDLVDISVMDTVTRIFHQENSVDAANGYGRIQFRTNAVANSSFPTRGGFQFTVNTTDVLFINSTGASSFNGGASSAPATSGTTTNSIVSFKPNDGNNAIIMGAYPSSPFGNWIQSQSTAALGTTFPLILQPIGGNVGIGTTNPYSLLELFTSTPKLTLSPSQYSGNYRTYLGTRAGAEGVLQFGNNNVNYIVAGNTNTGGYLQFYVNATSDFIAGTNGTLAMTINSAAQVGIGTASPSGYFTVKTPSYSSGYTPVYFGNTSYTSWNRSAYDTFILQQDDVTSFRMVEKNGETTGADQVMTFCIGDGTARISTSAQPLEIFVGGSPGGIAYQGLSGTRAMRINTDASTSFYSSVSASGGFFESSDKRLKEELIDNPSSVNIENVKPKLYIKNGKEELGYYAQDLENILPSSVTKNEDGFLNLSYTQVHTAKIANLEREVEELKALIKTLIK